MRRKKNSEPISQKHFFTLFVTFPTATAYKTDRNAVEVIRSIAQRNFYTNISDFTT